MNADIHSGNKTCCLQLHMSCPCTILFHGLTVFIKGDIILDEWFKLLTMILYGTVSDSKLSAYLIISRINERMNMHPKKF